MLLSMFELAIGPMLWIVFVGCALATVGAIASAVTKRGPAFAIAGVTLPFVLAAGGAWLELRHLSALIAEEGSSLSTVAPSLSRALMLGMLGFAATLAPAIPAAMGAPKHQISRWPLIPLFLVPVLALAQVPFGYPLSSLIRLVAYFGVAGVLAKRGASFAILMPVVAAGECAAVAVAHVDLFSSLALSGVLDVAVASSREIAAGRWFGVAAFGAVVLAQAIGRRWWSLLSLPPVCLLFAWLGDATDRVTTLVR